MTWDDLTMVNFHTRADGTWSWSAYRKPHSMWRSNTNCRDPLDCLEELMHEMVLTAESESGVIVHGDDLNEAASPESTKPPAGDSTGLQVVRVKNGTKHRKRVRP